MAQRKGGGGVVLGRLRTGELGRLCVLARRGVEQAGGVGKGDGLGRKERGKLGWSKLDWVNRPDG